MRRLELNDQSIAARVNLTPLIDMVFILLIFFMVTSSFVKESGVDVSRPQARTATPAERANIIITVTRDGALWIDGKQIDIRSMRSHIERLHSENPEGAVVILADDESHTGLVVRVLDNARLAGVENVAIAATPPD